MNKAEYLLLDSVVKYWYPLQTLASEDYELVFNRPEGHGLTQAELVRVLHHLFQSGDLIASRTEKLEPQCNFVPTRFEIEEALLGKLEMIYGLTDQGGARWEAISRPDWNRYIDAGIYANPDEGAEIIAIEQHLVRQYFSLSDYIWWDISVVPSSERWEVLKPWQATYWKSLPIGHRLSFRYVWKEEAVRKNVPLSVERWLVQLNKWYTRYGE